MAFARINYEDDLIKDVVGLIDRSFPVQAERSGRALGGLSMGGYGAVKIGLKHHEMFPSVNSHSGALAILRDPFDTDNIKDIGPELARIFGKAAKGGPEDPFGIVEKLDHGRIPALRIDCGKGDFLLDQNRAFHRHLESMQIAHEYEEFVGAQQLGILGPARPGSDRVPCAELEHQEMTVPDEVDFRYFRTHPR